MDDFLYSLINFATEPYMEYYNLMYIRIELLGTSNVVSQVKGN
ncbi:hypothetical protein bmyco0002_26330 [Bacillus pseudomycoides]|nr:hypothetical protein bmyco0002_26330 [Bacillus pseudomycoides]